MENEIIKEKEKRDTSVNLLSLIFVIAILFSIGLFIKYSREDHNLLRLFTIIIYLVWLIEECILYITASFANKFPNWKKHLRKEAYLVLIFLFVSYVFWILSAFFPDCTHKMASVGISFGAMLCSLIFLGVYIEGVFRAREKLKK